METIQFLSDFLKKIGIHNYLALGAAVIIIWLLISGFSKGLKKRGRDEDAGNHEKKDPDDEAS
jgi:hypothetical protein